MESALVSVEKLVKRGFINDNVEDSILRTLIIRVQDTIVEPIVGTNQFKRLLQGIDDDDLTEAEITLMDDYIVPVMIAGCDKRSINVVTHQIRNKTVGSGKDAYIDPDTREESAGLKDDLRADMNVYIRRLQGYLYDNRTAFPLYNEWSCKKENINPNKKNYRSSISIL